MKMEIENLTLDQLVKILMKMGFDMNIAFKEKPPIRHEKWGLYLRHMRTKRLWK